MVAGAVEAPLTLVPMQNISIKMTHDANKPPAQQRYPKFFPGLALIAREEGVAGLVLKGLTPTILKNVVNYAIRFPLYLNIKKAMLDSKAKQKPLSEQGDVELNFLEAWLCGAIAGGASCVFSHPLDVVKAQMMSLDAHKFQGSNIACLRSTLQHGGVQALYTGKQSIKRRARRLVQFANSQHFVVISASLHRA